MSRQAKLESLVNETVAAQDAHHARRKNNESWRAGPVLVLVAKCTFVVCALATAHAAWFAFWLQMVEWSAQK